MADINRVFRKGDVCEFSNQNWIIVSDITFNQNQQRCYAFLLEKDTQRTSNKINAAMEGFYLDLDHSKYLINRSSCMMIYNKAIGEYKGTYEDTEVIEYIEKLFLDMMKDMYSKQEINVILNGYSVTKCTKIVKLPNATNLSKEDTLDEKDNVEVEKSKKTTRRYNKEVSRYIKNLTKRQAKIFVEFYNSNNIIDIITKYNLDNYRQLTSIMSKCTELLGKNNCNFDSRRKNSTGKYKNWDYGTMDEYLTYFNNHTEAETYIRFFKNNEPFSIVKTCKMYCEKHLIKGEKEQTVDKSVLLESNDKSETIINALQKSEFVSTAKKCIFETPVMGGGYC